MAYFAKPAMSEAVMLQLAHEIQRATGAVAAAHAAGDGALGAAAEAYGRI